MDLNATQAAIRAGYSEKTASEMGYENLSKPQIADAIADAMTERSAETKIDSAWVLKRAALLADFNIGKFVVVGDNGLGCYDFTSATLDDWYCIQEYTVKQVFKNVIPVTEVKLKRFDVLRALELVGKHVDVQAFREVKEITGPGGGPIKTINGGMTVQQAAAAYAATLRAPG